MAHVMIYFVASPKIVVNRLGNLQAHPDLAGVKEEILRQAIIVASDPDVTKVCYATLIPEELLAVARTRPQFRGKGLTEMQTDFPVLYSKIAQKLVELEDGTRVLMDMADALPAGATQIEADLPLHSFMGFDPWTGEIPAPPPPEEPPI